MKVLSGRWGWQADTQVFRVKVVTAAGKFVTLECASSMLCDIEAARRSAGVQ